MILLVGLLIRSLALAHALAPGVSAPTMDEMNYRELACEILDHKRYAAWSEGFLTQSTRAPLYPLFIASAYSISGSRGYAVPKALNLIFDMCAILAVFMLARRLFGERPAIIAAATYAVFGHAVNYMLISSPHTLAVLLTLLVVLALVNFDRRYKSAMVLFVFFYVLLIHTRPVFLLVVPFLIPAIYLQLSKFNLKHLESSSDDGEGSIEKSSSISPFKHLLNVLKTDSSGKLLKTILPVALIALLCLPWGIRNYRIHKTIVPVCTIAGWHIASNGSFDMKLSLKFLTDHIYAPKHRGFTEGDYFVLGRRMFLESFLEHPVKLPLFGSVRLVRGWSTPAPWWRFLLPKAYLFPIRVGSSFIIPLPDFEGIIYLFVFANLAAFAFLRRRALLACLVVGREFRGILVLCAGYALAHVIGIPLIAYRFIIEPLFIVFGVALFWEFYGVFRESRDSANLAVSGVTCDTIPTRDVEVASTSGKGGDIAILAVCALIINVALIIPAFHALDARTFDYAIFDKARFATPKSLGYEALRSLQWKHLGSVPDGTRSTISGMVVYGTRGFRFDPDEYNPVKSAESASARLRVEYDFPGAPLGIGDVRLNFKKDQLPPDGEFVKVYGTVETGPFKELILNVEKVARKSSIHLLNRK